MAGLEVEFRNFLEEALGKNTEVEITYRDIVNFLIRKVVDTDLQPTDVMSGIRRLLSEYREKQVIAKIGSGRYLYAPNGVTEDRTYARSESPLVETIDQVFAPTTGFLIRLPDTVVDLAASEQYLVVKNLEAIDFEQLSRISF